MIDAQILQTMPDGTSVSVYSPWFSRGGDRAIFTLEVVEGTLSSLLSTLTVQPFHKNSDEAGDGAQVSGLTISRDSLGNSSAEFGPFKELVRYKFSIGGTSMDLRWAAFRMLTPVWYDAVEA